jgi:CheY-like chemotaxis protein
MVADAQLVGVSGQIYQLCFAVKDTGIGIPPDRLNRLFQSFSQVDASTTRRYGGTGLGLAISKRLSELMGGTMWVKSQVGQGSTFYFTIVAQTAPQLQRYLPGYDRFLLAGKHVLIVDDNETNRRILLHQTRGWGMQPTAVASGPQALALLDQDQLFDLAILDMHMPDMDGLTLAAEIRSLEEDRRSKIEHGGSPAPFPLTRHDPLSSMHNPQFSHLPLVMLTSLGRRPEDSASMLFAAFMTKPIKPAQLFQTLASILAGKPVAANKPASKPLFDGQIAQRQPLHILLAEDNAVNQKVALQFLGRLGYRADVAANGLEVLAALERQSYDVVLMDVQMPEMDGVEATRRIRQLGFGLPQPRIIAITANALQGDREKCLAAGMDDYISKPVQMDELLRALTESGSQASQTSPVCLIEETKTAIFDPTMLGQFQAEMGQDGAEMAAELIEVFLADTPHRLTELQASLAQADADRLQKVAHSLKSAAALLGATNLSKLCQELETMGRSGVLVEAAEKVTEAIATYDQLESILMAEQQKLETIIVS